MHPIRYALTALALLPIVWGGLAAQELATDERIIRLRLFGSDSVPIGYESGRIRFLNPENLQSDDPELRLHRNPYYVRRFHLPDRMFLLDSFPVDLHISQGRSDMRIRLDADVDRIPFRVGNFNVPWRFEPLFGLRGLEGTKILGQHIACFQVAVYTQEPVWTSFVNTSLLPFIFDTTVGHSYNPYGKPGFPMVRRPWQGGGIISLDEVGGADPRRTGGRDPFYTSYDGRHWTAGSDGLNYASGWTDRSSRTITFFFATNRIGWWVVDTGFREDGRVVLRTTDGGLTWRPDTLLSAYRIVDALQRTGSTAWFLGMDSPDDRGQTTIRLYTGRVDGTDLQPVAWPEGFNPQIQVNRYSYFYPRLIATAGPDGLILYQPLPWRGLRMISFDSKIDRVTDIPGFFQAFQRAPDSTGWMIVQDTGWTNQEEMPSGWLRYSTPWRLLRISYDGLDVRPVLTSNHPLLDVSFADATTGALIGNTFVLLTVDGGKSWRFLPGDSILSLHGNPNHPFDGRLITSLWPHLDTLRLVYPSGTLDIPTGSLNPPMFCGNGGEPRESLR